MRTLSGLILVLLSTGAIANGGLSLDTVEVNDYKAPAAIVDTSVFAQGNVSKFENDDIILVDTVIDTEALIHGSES